MVPADHVSGRHRAFGGNPHAFSAPESRDQFLDDHGDAGALAVDGDGIEPPHQEAREGKGRAFGHHDDSRRPENVVAEYFNPGVVIADQEKRMVGNLSPDENADADQIAHGLLPADGQFFRPAFSLLRPADGREMQDAHGQITDQYPQGDGDGAHDNAQGLGKAFGKNPDGDGIFFRFIRLAEG